jgi:hypothetical protein
MVGDVGATSMACVVAGGRGGGELPAPSFGMSAGYDVASLANAAADEARDASLPSPRTDDHESRRAGGVEQPARADSRLVTAMNLLFMSRGSSSRPRRGDLLVREPFGNETDDL